MRLGSRVVDSSARLVMGIVNRTPDSFYDAGRDYGSNARSTTSRRWSRVRTSSTSVVSRRARAMTMRPARRSAVSTRSSQRCAAQPGIVISVDTWRAEVGTCRPRRAVPTCSTTRGAVTTPHWWTSSPRSTSRSSARTRVVSPRAPMPAGCVTPTSSATSGWPVGLAERLVAQGCREDGSSSTRRTTSTRTPGTLGSPAGSTSWWGWAGRSSWPRSNKDFVGETLGVAKYERLEGTLATLAICAWPGRRSSGCTTSWRRGAPSTWSPRSPVIACRNGSPGRAPRATTSRSQTCLNRKRVRSTRLLFRHLTSA